MKAKRDFKASVASLPVYNATFNVTKEAVKLLGEFVLVVRDICHCVDLLSKDAANTAVLKIALDQAKIIFDFCRIYRIDEIRRKAISFGSLNEKHTIINLSETRMNNAHDHIEASLKMLDFVREIRSNA